MKKLLACLLTLTLALGAMLLHQVEGGEVDLHAVVFVPAVALGPDLAHGDLAFVIGFDVEHPVDLA